MSEAPEYCDVIAVSTGLPCRIPRGQCKHHAPKPRPRAEEQPAPIRRRDNIALDAARARDARGVAWAVIEWAVAEDLSRDRASTVATLLRVLTALGPEPRSEQQALEDVVLHGLIMGGFPPRTEAQWARARELFTQEALEEIASWSPLGEADARYVGQPLGLLDAAGVEGRPPGVVENEH